MCADRMRGATKQTNTDTLEVNETLTNLALTVVVELDAGPGGDLGVGVAAQFGLQGSPQGTVCQPLELIQGCLSPHLS